MTGPERADLQIVIGMVTSLDEKVAAGFTDMGLRLRRLEDKDLAAVAVASFREASRQKAVITRRFIVGAIIATLSAGGGIVALAVGAVALIHAVVN